jgi:hypothetical protein
MLTNFEVECWNSFFDFLIGFLYDFIGFYDSILQLLTANRSSNLSIFAIIQSILNNALMCFAL